MYLQSNNYVLRMMNFFKLKKTSCKLFLKFARKCFAQPKKNKCIFIFFRLFELFFTPINFDVFSKILNIDICFYTLYLVFCYLMNPKVHSTKKPN